MVTFLDISDAHILGTSVDVDPSLLSWLLRGLPRGSIADDICSAAESFKVEPCILQAVYALETRFRPLWMRWVEQLYMGLRVWIWRKWAVPVPNLTVGPFQLGLSTVLRFFGHDYPIHASSIAPRGSKELECIRRAHEWRWNVRIAAWQVGGLAHEAECLTPDRALRHIGLAYNGDIRYGIYLERLVKECRSAR